MAHLKDYVFEPFKVMEVEPRSKKVPRPRSGHRIACDDGKVYCFGGYNPSLPVSRSYRTSTWSPDKPLFRELWSYNMSTRKWKVHNVDEMPDELASIAMCLHGKHIMVFGGTGAPFGDRCSNDVRVWKFGDNKFHILDAKGSKPPGQYGQTIFCLNKHFYTVGGTNGFAYNCDIHRLNLQTLEWESVYVGIGEDGEPNGRYRHELARVDNKLYVIGGGTGEWSFELLEIPMFDLETRKWTVIKPKCDYTFQPSAGPLPRKCHSAVQVLSDRPQLFVVGGSDGQSVFDDIWRLDLIDYQWTLMRKSVLPRPVYFHSAAVTSYGCMYIFGGIEPKQQAVCRNNVLCKVWLCIPKLSEICWEAILNFQPELDMVDNKTLLNLGIPIHFVERLKS